ncbi:MAG: class I SAM-dependent methyltransferase [bacterium]
MEQNWNAEDYAINSEGQLKWGEELIEKLLLEGNESILDIGCGDGKISAKLSKLVKGGNVFAIDASESMVEFASRQFPKKLYPNLTFLKMNALEINKLNSLKKFDTAFSNACLHWVKNHAAVLKGVRSCLKTGGKILFQMGGRGNAGGVLSSIKIVQAMPAYRKYFENFAAPYYFYGAEDYEIWLHQNDFLPARVELISKDMHHEGDESFKGWLRTAWFPYADCLPEPLRDAFLAEVIEVYKIKHPADKFGNIHVKMIRLEVEAHAI